MTLIGLGWGRTVIDGENKDSVFTIGKANSNIDVTLIGLTIQRGQNIFGGGINNTGRLNVKDSTITKNAAEMGGGVYSSGGTLKLDNCLIAQNEAAAYDGGIGSYNTPTTICSCSIKENIALNGGDVGEDGADLVVADSSIKGNRVRAEGGGITIA